MDELKIYKKQITKKYKKLDNEKILELYNQNNIDEVIN